MKTEQDINNAPVFHTNGGPGEFLVSITGIEIGKESDEMDDLQRALNFDPVLRGQVLEAMDRQKDERINTTEVKESTQGAE